MKASDLIERLKALDPNTKVIENYWCEEDITLRAEDRGIKLTDEQIDKIILLIEKTFDASLGINWDVIDCATDNVLEVM